MTTNEITLITIDATAKQYASARELLSARTAALNAELQSIYQRRLPGIKKALAAAKDAQSDLSAQIEQAAHLFVKPRTICLHGIKLGLQKGKGTIDWSDDEGLVKRIRKQFPEQFDQLVKTTESPLKAGLAQLSIAELRALGCTVEETGDCVYIKAEDSSLDKLLKRILKEGSVHEVDEAAEGKDAA